MLRHRKAEEVAERLAGQRIDDAAAEAAVMLLGATAHPGQPGYVTGECGHPMEASEWVEGWRVCQSCPQEPLFDSDRARP